MVEFSGTLLGFDDYVSMYTLEHPICYSRESHVHFFMILTASTDMVLEDVTELYVSTERRSQPSALFF